MTALAAAASTAGPHVSHTVLVAIAGFVGGMWLRGKMSGGGGGRR